MADDLCLPDPGLFAGAKDWESAPRGSEDWGSEDWGSGDLEISGGGSIAVASGELFEAADSVGRVATLLSECRHRALGVDRGLSLGELVTADAPVSALAAEKALDDAASALDRASHSAVRLHDALLLSAGAYGAVDGSLEEVSTRLAARVGNLFGLALPAIALLLLPSVIGIGVSGAIGFAILTPQQRRGLAATLPGWFRKNSGALSDPRVVQLVRLAVMSADDVGGGVLRLPPDLVPMLGDEGIGVLGLGSSAGMIVAASHPAGALAETAVSVTRLGRTTLVSPASGYADRASRVPEGAAQVRIERYRQRDKPDRFEVYIGGTRDFSPIPRTEPWDMTSNVDAIAGIDAGSTRVAREAMASAGVTASTPVIFTGYSQGGLVAADLAASGSFDTKGLYTLGAPAAQVAVPPSIPWVAIEHTDDLVPAVGGTWASADPVLVRRELFAGRPVDTSVAFPAHQLDAYRQTAALADGSGERRLVASVTGFESFGEGATSVESTLYRGRRVGP